MAIKGAGELLTAGKGREGSAAEIEVKTKPHVKRGVEMEPVGFTQEDTQQKWTLQWS